MPTLRTVAERNISAGTITELLESVYFDFASGGGYDVVTPPTEIRIRMDYSEYDENGYDINKDQTPEELVLLFSQAKGFRLFYGEFFANVDDMDRLFPKDEGRRYAGRYFFGDIFSKHISNIFMTANPTHVSVDRK